MAWLPISGVVPQYVDANGVPYSGAVLKPYAVNSSTAISFSVDSSGTSTVGSIALNASGFPEVSGNEVIPHLDQNYKLALYPTQAAADANSGAIWAVDNITLAGLTAASETTATGEINVWPVISYPGADFDGTNDYMLRGAGLTGAADGKKGTFVCFVTFDAAASAIEYIVANTGLAFAVRRDASGTITILAENAGGSVILQMSTVAEYETVDAVYCIMASWDLATPGSQQIYVNDVSSLLTTTFTNDTIDYTVANWSVGADVSGGNKLNGNLFGVWLDTTSNLNFDLESNRRRFRDDSGRPVFLGTYGEIPTGTQPILALGTIPGTSYAYNFGSGGDFTITGSLGTASVTHEGQYGTPRPLVTKAAASTSGTSVDFTNIPPWASRITLNLIGCSSLSTNIHRVIIGDSGGTETSGYTGGVVRLTAAATGQADYSTGFAFSDDGAAARTYTGTIVLERASGDGLTWNCHGNLASSGGVYVMAGSKTLTAALDRLSYTAGGDTFDAGSIQMTIE